MDICIIQTVKGDIVNVITELDRKKIWEDHEDGPIPKELYEYFIIRGEIYSFYFTQIN